MGMVVESALVAVALLLIGGYFGHLIGYESGFDDGVQIGKAMDEGMNMFSPNSGEQNE